MEKTINSKLIHDIKNSNIKLEYLIEKLDAKIDKNLLAEFDLLKKEIESVIKNNKEIILLLNNHAI